VGSPNSQEGAKRFIRLFKALNWLVYNNKSAALEPSIIYLTTAEKRSDMRSAWQAAAGGGGGGDNGGGGEQIYIAGAIQIYLSTSLLS
jgi:hypothetical protein